MTITAQIIADSISPQGIRLTTMQLRYPRFIHSEFMTHRMFSRNASSSRAIPVARMIEDLRRDPAMPVYWGSHKPGMQAGAELTDEQLEVVKTHWESAMFSAITMAKAMMDAGLHKQIANRILEPWAHINVVVTAVSWQNFFALRSHPDAQPEIKVLSDAMQAAMAESVPFPLVQGQWHLPYVLDSDWVALRAFAKKGRITRDEPQYDELAQLALRVSVARCARVSYLTHDGRQTSVEEDMELANRLIGATPLHASPAEHQGTPDTQSHYETSLVEFTENDSKEELISSGENWDHPQQHGNLTGWIQYRKTLEGEFVAG